MENESGGLESLYIERIRLELIARKLMIMAMAVAAVFAGAAVMLTGAPNFLEDWFSPWSRYFIGGVPFVFGSLASLGGLMTDRTSCGWWAQFSGLLGLALWYASMAVVYIGLVVVQGVSFVGPGETLPEGVTGRGYVPMIYLGLLAATCIPLVTLVRLRRPGVYGPLDH